MKRLSVVLIAGTLTAGVWLTGPRPTEAHGTSASLGVGFVVGGASFHVAFVPGAYVPYFYRLETPLFYQGYSCTGYCYINGGHHYHAPYCPVVRYHFTRHRYDGYRHHDHRYGGDYRGYPWHRHDKRRYYDRHPNRRHGHGAYRDYAPYRHDRDRHYRGRGYRRGDRYHDGSASRHDDRSRSYRKPEGRSERARRAGSARRTRPRR